jgi:hypothetical protein
MLTREPDFEAEVRFLGEAEGGRSQPKQGHSADIHWDADSSNAIWMVWPQFLDDAGSELAEGAEVPQMCRAHFYVVSPQTHSLLAQQSWLREGTRFHITEGNHRVAVCRVTNIFGASNAKT